MGKIYTVFNPKGGVAKSTSVRLLSYLMAEDPNKNILIIDLCQNSSAALNFTGNRTQFAGHTIFDYINETVKFQDVIQHVPNTKNKNLYFIPADEKVEMIQRVLAEKGILIGREQHLFNKLNEEGVVDMFDAIWIDTHPSQSDLNALSGLIASNQTGGKILIPTFTDIESEEAAKQAIKIVSRNLTCEYLVVPTKIRTNIGNKIALLKNFRNNFKSLIDSLESTNNKKGQGKVSDYFITESVKIDHFSMARKPFEDYLKNKYSRKVIEDYKNVLNELEA